MPSNTLLMLREALLILAVQLLSLPVKLLRKRATALVDQVKLELKIRVESIYRLPLMISYI